MTMFGPVCADILKSRTPRLLLGMSSGLGALIHLGMRSGWCPLPGNRFFSS